MNILELKKFRDKYGMSRDDLAKLLGVSLSTLDTWEYRIKKVPEDRVENIRYVFSMYIEKKETNSFIVKEPEREYGVSKLNFETVENFKLIENFDEIPRQFRSWAKPFYPDLKVGAGFEISEFRTQTKFFLLVPFSERVEFWAQVEGSSMFPNYNSNDFVGLSEVFLDDVFGGDDYVIDLLHGKSHLKRIEILKDQPEKFLLCSYNPEHQPKEMNIDKIRAFFKVKMHIHYK